MAKKKTAKKKGDMDLEKMALSIYVLADKVGLLERRIDTIVAAIAASKKVKGL